MRDLRIIKNNCTPDLVWVRSCFLSILLSVFEGAPACELFKTQGKIAWAVKAAFFAYFLDRLGGISQELFSARDPYLLQFIHDRADVMGREIAAE